MKLNEIAYGDLHAIYAWMAGGPKLSEIEMSFVLTRILIELLKLQHANDAPPWDNA